MTLIELPDEQAVALKVARPLDLARSGGSLFQPARFSNGTALPGLGGLPTLDRIGGGVEHPVPEAS